MFLDSLISTACLLKICTAGQLVLDYLVIITWAWLSILIQLQYAQVRALHSYCQYLDHNFFFFFLKFMYRNPSQSLFTLCFNFFLNLFVAYSNIYVWIHSMKFWAYFSTLQFTRSGHQFVRTRLIEPFPSTLEYLVVLIITKFEFPSCSWSVIAHEFIWF